MICRKRSGSMSAIARRPLKMTPSRSRGLDEGTVPSATRALTRAASARLRPGPGAASRSATGDLRLNPRSAMPALDQRIASSSRSSLPEHLAVHGNAPLLRTSAKGRTDAFVEWCGYGRTRRNPSVPGPTKNGSKGSDLAHSPSRRRMTGNCACQTAVAHILQRDGETAPASRLMGGLLTSPSSKTADASRSRSKAGADSE